MSSAGGRPTHCTPEICAEFERLLGAMNYFVTVCNLLQIPEDVAYVWLRKGEAGDDAAGDWPDAYRTFAQSVKNGTARGEMSAVTEINRHGRPHEVPEGQVPGQWQALMTLLERRFPDRWGRRERQQIEHSGSVEQKHTGDLTVTFKLLGELPDVSTDTDDD
jgi:transposase